MRWDSENFKHSGAQHIYQEVRGADTSWLNIGMPTTPRSKWMSLTPEPRRFCTIAGLPHCIWEGGGLFGSGGGDGMCLAITSDSFNSSDLIKSSPMDRHYRAPGKPY